jgi:NDP-sugar pyrophosphorylase family protein
MIGVIVLPGRREALHGLDQHAPLSRLPLGDRPFLQHMLEFLLHNGIRNIEMILEHAPERVEALLGDGARWGCHIRYHLAQVEFPYKPLQVIPDLDEQPCVMLSGDALPLVSLGQYTALARPTVFAIEGRPGWQGCGVFPAGTLTRAITSLCAKGLATEFDKCVEIGAMGLVAVAEWVDATTPGALLANQARLLAGDLGTLMMGGIEERPGVWISRNVVMHPSVSITAPVYIGPNCRLKRNASIGPNAVLSGDCMVDEHSSIRNALLTRGTYVGQNLEVEDSIIDRNLLVNVRLNTALSVADSFLLGQLSLPPVHRWPSRLLESSVAVVLMGLFLPLYLVSCIAWLALDAQAEHLTAVQIPTADDPRGWRHWKLPYITLSKQRRISTAGWLSFLWTFLPGLPAVALGRLSFVGLPPHCAAEIEAMPSDWKLLYLRAKAGLITEASVATAENADVSELYLAEAYYSVMRSWKYDLRLTARYFARLIMPARKAGL